MINAVENLVLDVKIKQRFGKHFKGLRPRELLVKYKVDEVRHREVPLNLCH